MAVAHSYRAGAVEFHMCKILSSYHKNENKSIRTFKLVQHKAENFYVIEDMIKERELTDVKQLDVSEEIIIIEHDQDHMLGSCSIIIST